MPALPSFPTVPNGYDPSRVEDFIRRLIDRSRSEIATARSRSDQLQDDLAEAYEALEAADVRIRTLEMDLDRVLEGFAETGTPIDPEETAEEVVTLEEAEDLGSASSSDVEEPVSDQVEVSAVSVPFTEPAPELSALEEKAARAERAIRGRFLSST